MHENFRDVFSAPCFRSHRTRSTCPFLIASTCRAPLIYLRELGSRQSYMGCSRGPKTRSWPLWLSFPSWIIRSLGLNVDVMIWRVFPPSGHTSAIGAAARQRPCALAEGFCGNYCLPCHQCPYCTLCVVICILYAEWGAKIRSGILGYR